MLIDDRLGWNAKVRVVDVFLFGEIRFVLQLVVYFMLFSVNIVYSIIVVMKNVAMFTFIHTEFIVSFMVHWNYKRVCCLFDSSVLSSPRSIIHILLPNLRVRVFDCSYLSQSRCLTRLAALLHSKVCRS